MIGSNTETGAGAFQSQTSRRQTAGVQIQIMPSPAKGVVLKNNDTRVQIFQPQMQANKLQ
jgi:hypothetical protein